MEEFNEGFVLSFVAHPERTITRVTGFGACAAATAWCRRSAGPLCFEQRAHVAQGRAGIFGNRNFILLLRTRGPQKWRIARNPQYFSDSGVSAIAGLFTRKTNASKDSLTRGFPHRLVSKTSDPALGSESVLLAGLNCLAGSAPFLSIPSKRKNCGATVSADDAHNSRSLVPH